jgi:hypothetical protein
MAVRPAIEPARRKCLKCRREHQPEHRDNWICRYCKLAARPAGPSLEQPIGSAVACAIDAADRASDQVYDAHGLALVGPTNDELEKAWRSGAVHVARWRLNTKNGGGIAWSKW